MVAFAHVGHDFSMGRKNVAYIPNCETVSLGEANTVGVHLKKQLLCCTRLP
jgi:hypothetical protein